MLPDITEIKTETDYNIALESIKSLWECAPGTRDVDKLNALCILVDDYEQKYFPIVA